MTPSQTPSHLRLSQKTHDLVLDFGQIFGILKRGWWLILGAAFVGTLIAVVMVLQVTPTYTSSAKILLGQKSRIDDTMGAMFPELNLDAAAVSGEIAILTSERMLSQVSELLDLENHPEFNPDLRPEEGGPAYLEQATDWAVDMIKLALGMGSEAPVAPSPDTDGASPVRDAAMTGKNLLGSHSDHVGLLETNLLVRQEGRSNLLNIRYVSTDRMLAAAVPNALVELYLEDQIDRRFSVLSRVTSGLGVRLDSMRERLEESERAVIEFRNRNLAEGFSRRDQLEEQLAALSTRLSAVRAENAELASDLKGIDAMIDSQGAIATAGMFPSSVIDGLLEELASLRARAVRLNTQLGENNTVLQAEVRRLETTLTNEIMRRRDDRARIVELSTGRTAALEAELRMLEQRAILQAEREVRLAQLEREQAAAQVVYETFLDRFSATKEVIDFQEGDAQIIDYADPPPAPSAPNKKLSAALGCLAGGFLGIALVFIRHLTRNEITTALELGHLLPAFTPVPMPRVRRLFRRADPLGLALRVTPSPFGEAVRTLRSTVLITEPAIVSIVSPLEAAGKTTTAINLARSIARAGRSCVLVDGDVRRGDIAQLLKLHGPIELQDLIASPHTDLDAALQKDPESDLRVITARHDVTDPGGVLLSKNLPALVAELREHFEVVVFDTAPLINGNDALPLIQNSDAVVMVVPSGSVVDEVRIASGKLGRFSLKSKTAVLNFVSEKEVGTYY